MKRQIPTWMRLAAGIASVSWAPASAAEPEQFNYDEAKVPAYTLPEVLQMQDGRVVASTEDWQRQRRPELLELFRTTVYGRRPSEPKSRRFTVDTTTPEYLKGKASRKDVRVEITTPEGAVAEVKLTMFVPHDAPGPVPAFVGVHLFDTASDDPQPGKPLEEDAGESLPGTGLLDLILARGYAIATLNPDDFCPDDKNTFRQGVLAALYPGVDGPPGPDQPGAIAVWAWALSRALDYCEHDSQIDARRVVAVGHSRRGKTALWAGAEDERFAIVISNDSGCGGAALSRRRFGETVARINQVFPHWFCGNFKKYNHREHELPLDQHELVALMAPRPVYVASAAEDGWADPRGEFLAAAAASPVYRLFGLGGLEGVENPPLNRSLGDFVGYHIRVGKHALTDFDWVQYLDFADRHFGRRPADADR